MFCFLEAGRISIESHENGRGGDASYGISETPSNVHKQDINSLGTGRGGVAG